MKVLWRKIIIIALCVVGLYFLFSFLQVKQSRIGALKIAKGLDSYKAFVVMANNFASGKVAQSCVYSEIKTPCESEWVDCIEDAWVIEFRASNECLESHERLFLVIVVDPQSGRIISQYPEAPYFKNSRYCMEDYDCSCIESECSNFIWSGFKDKSMTGGRCQDFKCVPSS